ncbi:MAG: hypothetical protein TREMPRED_000370 [Tremellales sp. Tagirdzhanova-0007]|nr:MAG: hypothetical protein TREMPRED_000370 [Tremellales sp. Tagirdzhanova-0007]
MSVSPGRSAGEQRPLLSDGDTPKNSSKGHHNLAGLPSLQFRLIFLGVWLCAFLGSLDGTVVATILSDIGSSFDASNQASWLGTAYLLSVCCFTPMYGRVSDMIGRRGALLIALTSFTIGTVLCGVAPSMWFLIAARCIAGVGGGGVLSVGVIIMSDLVDLRRRGLYQGYMNIAFGLGGALGGPLGGFCSDKFGWRTAFLIQIPLLLITIILVYTQVRIPHPKTPAPPSSSNLPNAEQSTLRSALGRIDYLGSLTLTLAVASLLVPISIKTASTKASGEDYRWSDPIVWGLLAASVVMTTIFVLVEGFYAPEPILPLQLLTRRTPIAVALSSLIMVINIFSILYNVPLFFSAVRLESSSVAGAHLLPYSIMIGAGSLSIGWLMQRTGKYWWASLISASIIVVSSGMLATWRVDSPEWITWVAQMPSGFGYAGVLTSSLVALMTNVTREGKGEQAVATSMAYLFRNIGQVLGVSLSAAIMQGILSTSLKRLITGPDASRIIYTIRHSTSSIRDLAPEHLQAAVQAYEHALHVIFIFNLVLSVINVLVLTIVKEDEMPDQRGESLDD